MRRRNFYLFRFSFLFSLTKKLRNGRRRDGRFFTLSVYDCTLEDMYYNSLLIPQKKECVHTLLVMSEGPRCFRVKRLKVGAKRVFFFVP